MEGRGSSITAHLSWMTWGQRTEGKVTQGHFKGACLPLSHDNCPDHHQAISILKWTIKNVILLCCVRGNSTVASLLQF